MAEENPVNLHQGMHINKPYNYRCKLVSLWRHTKDSFRYFEIFSTRPGKCVAEYDKYRSKVYARGK